MYAGTTLLKDSGRFVGVHQKIDRIARHRLGRRLPKSVKFPGLKDILYFEGNNGPDGVKRKGSSADEPWHFIDPSNPNDRALINVVNDHIHNLTTALKSDNHTRASFEAAWLAHSIVDAMTPAHHYPLGDKIEELWGKPHYDRKSLKGKTIIRGVNLRDTLSKNWEYMGADGVFTAHLLFEAGVASAIATDKMKLANLTKSDTVRLEADGFEKMFISALQKIYEMHMYDEFGQTGWNYKLAKQTKTELVPEMIRMVALAWYAAAIG